MDIDKVSGRIHPTEFAGHGKVKGENTFAQTLDRAMDAVHAEEGPTKATCAVTKAVSDSPCEVSRATRGAMQRASKLLDLLEEYAEALKNPQMT
ncbi:MAG: hypothetical protein HWN51_01960, partial [Desulfobacterales bacterium]|nr:hypothetical protein [Desulfobacterales bacterium]